MLSRGQLAEIASCQWTDRVIELENDAARWNVVDSDIELHQSDGLTAWEQVRRGVQSFTHKDIGPGIRHTWKRVIVFGCKRQGVGRGHVRHGGGEKVMEW